MSGAACAFDRARLPPRPAWGRLLALAGRATVLETAQALAAGSRIEPLAPPEAGLVPLALRDSVAGTAFHVGEMPAARLALRIRMRDGRIAEGGAIVQGEDVELAQAVALLDAVLAHGLPGAERAAALLAEGARRAEAIEHRRALLRARTRVDFTAFADLSGGPE